MKKDIEGQMSIYDFLPTIIDVKTITFEELKEKILNKYPKFVVSKTYDDSPCLILSKKKHEIELHLHNYAIEDRRQYISFSYQQGYGSMMGVGCPCDSFDEVESLIQKYMERIEMAIKGDKKYA